MCSAQLDSCTFHISSLLPTLSSSPPTPYPLLPSLPFPPPLLPLPILSSPSYPPSPPHPFLCPFPSLCTVSTSMTPFAVYGIQRSSGMWPRNDPGIFQGFRVYIHSGWIVMEIVTIICGLSFFVFAPFPFLMLPVSFCIWFLSMDICPLVPGWPNNAFRVRQNVSLVVGLLTMAAAFLLECGMGAHPDYAFWLYLFGLLTFWTALTSSPSGSDLGAALYLLINISLGIIGSHLGRTTFHVFSTLGVIGYCFACVSNTREKWFTLWVLKAFAAAALFAQAIKTESNFEIVGGLLCVVLFNYSSLLFLASSELYYILVLATNLGFVASAVAFQRPISLWFFTIDGQYLDIVGLLCCFIVTLYHGGLILYALPQNLVSSWKQYKAHIYHLYRVAASIALSLCFVLLGHPGLAWLGALAIPLAAFNYMAKVGRNHQKLSFSITSFLLLVFGVFFSNFLQSNILYLICCLMLLGVMMQFLESYRHGHGTEKAVGCALSVVLALLSVLIHSRFMITIATIYIFCYLSYLAYQVFKNSLFFPLALVLMGIAIIYSGVMYQRSEDKIQAAVDGHMPKILTAFLSKSIYSDWGLPNWSASIAQSKFTWDSFMDAPGNWVLWSGALTYSLSKGSAPYIPILCALGFAFVGVSLMVLKLRQMWILDLNSKVLVCADLCVCVGVGTYCHIQGTFARSPRYTKWSGTQRYPTSFLGLAKSWCCLKILSCNVLECNVRDIVLECNVRDIILGCNVRDIVLGCSVRDIVLGCSVRI